MEVMKLGVRETIPSWSKERGQPAISQAKFEILLQPWHDFTSTIFTAKLQQLFPSPVRLCIAD